MITDSRGRVINYLRLAVTDRCNLRCVYCMPESGLNWLPQKELMTIGEMLRICKLFVHMGVQKIRITGGEPFIRKDLLPFLYQLSEIDGLREITITTNGLLTNEFVPDMKKIGIKCVNLSLDTLNEERFFQITRREGLDKVLSTMHALLDNDIHVKINAVVMQGKNIEDIIPLVQMTQTLPVNVRFIEEMPFNGGTHEVSPAWNFLRILEYIKEYFPTVRKVEDAPNATACNYHIHGYKGYIGIIAAYSRSFCGSCNRLRITPTGILRTCLYDAGKLNLKEAMRGGCNDNDLETMIRMAVSKKPKDGWAAQHQWATQNLEHQSMATIGG